MTPTEHEILKSELRTTAYNVLLGWVCELLEQRYRLLTASEKAVLALAVPQGMQYLLEGTEKAVVADCPAAESDLIAAEFQDAFEGPAREVMVRLTKALAR